MEVSGKKIDNVNKSQVGARYSVNKDSAGNFLFTMAYDKIHLHAKKEDIETDMDAANAATTEDPTEKMLNALTSANIVATVSPAGEVKKVAGYNEIGDKIMAGFSSPDPYARKVAHNKWEQLVGDGIVKKNMDQLFKIFPDSAVHIGDKWKLDSKQKGQFNLNLKNSFTLRGISDGIAFIAVDGEIKSDSTITNLLGYDVVSFLIGHQEGEYRVDTKSGMLLSSNITTSIEGTLQLMGRDIPVTIESSIVVKGKKVK